MQKQLDQVAEWHLKFGLPVKSTPHFPNAERLRLRQDILQEEVDELKTACMERDMVAVADAWADILFVLIGTAHELGIAPVMESVFDEVYRSNMSKLGENGEPVLRHDGKILKGPNYSKPDLAPIICENVY